MLKKILDKFFKKTLIMRNDGEPYLTRYYLYRKHFWWLPSMYIHCFHSSDYDMELHNHPWKKSYSLILKGSYAEEYRDKNNAVKSRVLFPGNINYVPENKFHRVDLLSENVWTLFISGPKVQRWGFWNRHTNKYIDYLDFFNKH